MPYSDRGLMKTDMQRSIAALEKSASYLLRLREIYEPEHPEYVKAIDVLLRMLSDVLDLFIEFSHQI
jgi:hypothetical protein